MITEEARRLYLYAAREAGVISLTSRCNLRCAFCSHRQNPPGVETFFLPPLPLEEVTSQVALLSPRRKVIMGESATRICEGEPFTHLQINEILSLIRNNHPRAPLQITTNGLLLTESHGPFLAGLKPLELILSLNSADAGNRAKLMGQGAAKMPPALEICARHNIPFHGSIVALPQVTGYRDIKRTLRCLQEWGALSTRIFLPGFTRLAPRELRFEASLARELADFCAAQAEALDMPVTLEPPLLEDLTPKVAGVLGGSPAAGAGIKRGDVLQEVAGRAPFSRAAAFRDVLRKEDPPLILKRGEETVSVILNKKAGEASGLVMDYDLEERTLNLIKRSAPSRDPEEALILTSVFAYPLLEAALKGEGRLYRLKEVENRFFGGSIGCSGLLTVEDLLRAAREEADRRPFSLVLLPGAAFDPAGRDLTRVSYLDMEEALGVPVVPL